MDRLDAYLHSNNYLVDRLVQPSNRTLRSDATPQKIQVATTSQKQKEKRNEALVHRLEKEMDKKTDAELLRQANEYQEG